MAGSVSKIEQLIDEIEKLVESSKPAPFSQGKVVVNKEQLLELTRELRMKTPDEIKRVRKIAENRDNIIRDAQDKANDMIERAHADIQNLINDHEIVQQALNEADAIMEDAQNQANTLVYQAEKEADSLRKGTMRYMAENLGTVQSLINSTMVNFDAKYKGMMSTLEKYHELIRENREEIIGAGKEQQDMETSEERPEPQQEQEESEVSQPEE